MDLARLRPVPLLALLLLNGCTTYYGQLAGGHLQLMSQRQPIQAILDDKAADPQLQARLAQALGARAFASGHLGLPDNDSYRAYATLSQPYAVWNLFATEAYSLEPHTWCFPIAGCVAYRGYYRQGAARAEAARLGHRGLDTQVIGIEAYSTLGWFADPLLSSMLYRDDDGLAALIFHELAHQRLYLPGDTEFNESYATFVEREGLRQWRAHRGLSDPDETRAQAQQQLIELMLDARERLRLLYAQPLAEGEMRQRKREEFSALRTRYRQLRDEAWQGRGYFDHWFARPLNNASLLPFGLYHRWVEAFAALFEASERDWVAFHQTVARLARKPPDERRTRLERLEKQQAERLAH
ncbi:aminopeptidase [Stutzerimonas tarimensis]|uniref:Aminopeptidase n=1 Tax=Stutzerimonas tarimensis TaxID=1507735 RepID=A0ABV7T567_9GAMM